MKAQKCVAWVKKHIKGWKTILCGNEIAYDVQVIFSDKKFVCIYI
jgi:oligoribonuclease (3'-5' exoribonuclease)